MVLAQAVLDHHVDPVDSKLAEQTISVHDAVQDEHNDADWGFVFIFGCSRTWMGRVSTTVERATVSTTGKVT